MISSGLELLLPEDLEAVSVKIRKARNKDYYNLTFSKEFEDHKGSEAKEWLARIGQFAPEFVEYLGEYCKEVIAEHELKGHKTKSKRGSRIMQEIKETRKDLEDVRR